MRPIILIAVLVVIVLLLDWQFMRWLWKRKLGHKKQAGPQPEELFPDSVIPPVQVNKAEVVEREAAHPTFQIPPCLNFSVALVLIGLGHYLLASEGKVSYGISVWLDEHFSLYTPNLDNVLTGLPILILGCTLLIFTMRRFNLPRGETNPGGLRQNILPMALLKTHSALPWISGATLVFIFLILQLANQLYSGLSVVLWLVVPLVFLVIAWRWDRQSGTALSPNLTRGDLLWMTGLLLAGLLIVSFRLQSVPDQIFLDESAFWPTARDIAQGTSHPGVFDFGVFTFSMLSSIGQAAALKVFGITFWGWRFSSVLAGVITIPPLYLLGRELFDRRVAVVSSIALITTPYFLAFARLGYNNIQTLFIVTLTLYWFYLGYKRSSAFYLFLAGCAAGLGSYTFAAARGLLPIVLLFLLASFFYRRQNYRSLLKAGVIFTLGWALLSMPQLAYQLAVDPVATRIKFLESIFLNTYYARNILAASLAYKHAPRLMIDQATLFFALGPIMVLFVRGIFRTFLAFHEYNLVMQHFIAGPLAGPFGVVFYIMGAAMALAGSCRGQRRFVLLLIWFGFMAVAFSGVNSFPPRQAHMVGLIPALALLIGAGLVTLVDLLGKLVPRLIRSIQMLCIGVLALVVSASGLYNYFVSMPQYYSPDFDQIISWYGLYSRGQPIYYAYSIYDSPDARPFILKEIDKEVPYTLLPAVALAVNPLPTRFDPHGMVFFPPEVSNIVLPALEKMWGEVPQTTQFYYQGYALGEAAWLPPMPIVLPLTFSAQLVDSYNRPVAWVLVFLAGLLVFFLTARRAWFERAPAWLRRALDWPFQPAVSLES